MSYVRVIPRDLFNEANLLKCLGALWIKLDDRVPADVARMTEDVEGPFLIEQDPSTGALECVNVQLALHGRPARLTRPLNSRAPWPLYLEPALDGAWFDPVAVFTDDGDLTDEFERLVGLQHGPVCERCDDTGVEPARVTADAGDGEGEDLPCSVCGQ